MTCVENAATDALAEAAASTAMANQASVELDKTKKTAVKESTNIKKELNCAAKDIKKLTEHLAQLKKDTEEGTAAIALRRR